MTREEAIKVLECELSVSLLVFGEKNDKETQDALKMAIEALKEQRPHGEWVWKEYNPDYDCGDIVCSKCSVVIYEGVPQARLKVVKWPFCPDCGADMREEGEADGL